MHQNMDERTNLIHKRVILKKIPWAVSVKWVGSWVFLLFWVGCELAGWTLNKLLNLFCLCFLSGKDFCIPVLWLLKTHIYCSVKIHFTCHKNAYFKYLTEGSLVILSSDATITINQIENIFFPWIRFLPYMANSPLTISQTIVYVFCLCCLFLDISDGIIEYVTSQVSFTQHNILRFIHEIPHIPLCCKVTFHSAFFVVVMSTQ